MIGNDKSAGIYAENSQLTTSTETNAPAQQQNTTKHKQHSNIAIGSQA